MALLPSAVCARYARFVGAGVRPFGNGLINKTLLVQSAAGERAVFQRLHPVFAGVVNHDIDAVTRHLAHKGLITPRVLPADDGALFVTAHDDDNGVQVERPWRALSFVEGTSVDKLTSPAQAEAAAGLVARFHGAMVDFAGTYQHVRSGVHDTKKHLAGLQDAVASFSAHRLFPDVLPLAQQLLAAAERLPDVGALPARHTHGDLKISNVLFAQDGTALCLVDLDTVGKMPWPHEMGDALRSWCNPLGEDVEQAGVDTAIFTAAVTGYAAARAFVPTADEVKALVDGLITICVELAARFAADALREAYFGWHSARYDSRGAHNLVRARGQWSLAQSALAQRATLEAIVQRAFRA